MSTVLHFVNLLIIIAFKSFSIPKLEPPKANGVTELGWIQYLGYKICKFCIIDQAENNECFLPKFCFLWQAMKKNLALNHLTYLFLHVLCNLFVYLV